MLETAASDQYFFYEGLLNAFGYELLGADNVQAAIAIFKLNVEEDPEAWNVYDSLGEAYMIAGNNTLAIQNYQKSIDLNPENTNGIEILNRLREEAGNRKYRYAGEGHAVIARFSELNRKHHPL